MLMCHHSVYYFFYPTPFFRSTVFSHRTMDGGRAHLSGRGEQEREREKLKAPTTQNLVSHMKNELLREETLFKRRLRKGFLLSATPFYNLQTSAVWDTEKRRGTKLFLLKKC